MLLVGVVVVTVNCFCCRAELTITLPDTPAPVPVDDTNPCDCSVMPELPFMVIAPFGVDNEAVLRVDDSVSAPLPAVTETALLTDCSVATPPFAEIDSAPFAV